MLTTFPRMKAEVGIFEPQAKDIALGQPVAIDTRESSW